MRRYKVIVDGRLKDRETEDRLRHRVKEFLGDGCEVIICDGGIDIKPLGQEYYGIYCPDDDSWICDKNGNLKWYPHRFIAEAEAEHMDSMWDHSVEVRSFNGIDEAEVA